MKDYPWPKEGDTLFKPDEDWMYNACLNKISDKLGLYAEGYKKAGDIVVHSLQDDRFEIDFVIYPIVFLYRQYVELRLKEIIRDGRQLFDEDGTFPKHHKIKELWKEARVILEKVWPDGPKEDLNAVESIISQFSEKDPDSISFRYDKNKKGEDTTSDTEYINVRNLYEVINRISGLLDGSVYGIGDHLDHKRGLDSYYSGY